MIETANILEILKDAFSALNDALGDSDLPVESDEEEREIAPVQYAARRISEVIQILSPTRVVEQRDAPVHAAIELLYRIRRHKAIWVTVNTEWLMQEVDAVLKTAAGG